jgi:hypothetical protein
MTREHQVAKAVIAIVIDELRRWMQGGALRVGSAQNRVEDLLRDEFADLKREASGDRILID